jgi:prepilin peptidase CpaA
MTLPAALVLAASLLAAISDVRTRRIPNALVIALFVCGFAVNAFLGWQHAVLDVVIAFVLLFAGTIAFSLKLIGGGDVKLLAAAAGTFGYPGAPLFIVSTLLCGGVIALIYSAMRGRLRSTIANLQTLALPLFAGSAPARLQTGTPMPYAVAIFAGACVTVVLRGLEPYVRLPW